MNLNSSDVTTLPNPYPVPEEAFAEFATPPMEAEDGLSESEEQLSPQDAIAGLSAIQDRLQQLERKDWRLWTAAIAVLLSMGTALALPLAPIWKQLSIALLFSAYAVAQQIVTRRIRGQLSRQIDSMLLSRQVDSVLNLKFRTEDSHQLAMLDTITGLYNRRFLEEHLSGELARSNGHDPSLSVAALHLKEFQQIIGSYGRAAGDLVLKYFGAELKKAIRSSDIAARTGQDEFMVLFPEGKPDQVPATLLRLADLEVELRGENVPIGFAAGLTAYEPGDSPAQLLDRAKQAVVADKSTGQAEPEILEAPSAVSPAAKDGVAEVLVVQGGPQPEQAAEAGQAGLMVLADKPIGQAEPEILEAPSTVSPAAKDGVVGVLRMQGDPQPEQAAEAGQRVRRAAARSAKPGRSATRRRRAIPAAAPVGEFAALAAAGLQPRSSNEPQGA